MARKGVKPSFIEEVTKAVQSLAVYGFPESHAISFAMLAYASAWLKVHRVKVRPVTAMDSEWPCTVLPDGSVRLGICYVRGLTKVEGARLLTERRRQAFSSHADFQLRSRLS